MQSMSLKQIRRIWKTNIRFSSLFAAGDTYEGRGETDVFAGYYYSIDLSLQRQLLLQIKFNLSMDKQSSVAQSTRYWLNQSSRKFPGQNTDLFFWINKVSDVFFSFKFWAGSFTFCRLHAAWHLCLGYGLTALSVKHHTKIWIFSFSGQAIARKMLS